MILSLQRDLNLAWWEGLRDLLFPSSKESEEERTSSWRTQPLVRTRKRKSDLKFHPRELVCCRLLLMHSLHVTLTITISILIISLSGIYWDLLLSLIISLHWVIFFFNMPSLIYCLLWISIIDYFDAITEQLNASLWHGQLGHMNKNAMKILSHLSYIPSLCLTDLDLYEHCIYGKHAELDYKINL